MLMEKHHYLPYEELKVSNYPEVAQVLTDIDLIQTYAMTCDQAVLAYNEGTNDKIDLDAVELRREVDRCRRVCDLLGNAPIVCYDLLTEVRAFQMTFQDLLFMKNRFGSEYIGKPTATSEEGVEG